MVKLNIHEIIRGKILKNTCKYGGMIIKVTVTDDVTMWK